MNIQDKINDLQKQLDALKTEAAKQDDVWPKNNDSYFTTLTDGGIRKFKWNNDVADNLWKNRGLVFRTREETERYDKRRILIASIREFAGHYKPVWDGHSDSYQLYFDTTSSRWYVCEIKTADYLPTCGYFKDEATAKACIEKFKNELHLLREV